MRKTITTWRLSFLSLPTEAQLESIRSQFNPLSKIMKPDDYGFVFREYGMSDHLIIEPGIELTPGEIALTCLTKAHSLGKGWVVMWPGFQKSGDGWPREEVERAARPEYLNGLNGWFSDGEHGGISIIPNLYSANFTVTVAEAESKQEPRTTVVKTEARPAAEIDPAAISSVSTVINLIIKYGRVSWCWNTSGAIKQIEEFGYKLEEEFNEEFFFSAQGQLPARIQAEDNKIRWIEFIIARHLSPHLLEENEFSAKQQEYERLFDAAVHTLRSLLGTPEFVGGAGEPGFPKDQWADLAAVWPQPRCRIMVQQKHNDKELPLELCLVFAP